MRTIGIAMVFVVGVLSSSSSWAKVKEWSIYTSEHFSVYTDAKEKKATELLNQFETFHQIVMQVTGAKLPERHDRMKIFMFSRKKDFDQFSPSKNMIGFYTNTKAGPRIVSGPGAGTISDEAVLFHEYVHYVMRGGNQFNYPLWFDEGFAEVLGATEIKRGKATVGAIPAGRAYDLMSGTSMPLSSILDPDRSKDSRQYWADFYAKAWFFVHYLQISTLTGDSSLKEQTRDYLHRYSLNEDPLQAFESSFGMTPDEMDDVLNKYAKQKRVMVLTFEIPKVEREFAAQALSRNESIFLLGELAEQIQLPELALTLLEELDESQPDSAKSLALHALLVEDSNPAEADLFKAKALDYAGDDPKVLRMVATLELDRYMSAMDTGADFDEQRLNTIKTMANKAIALDDKDIETYELLWNIAEEEDDPLEVAKNMMAAYQLDSTSIRLNMDIGLFLLNQQKPELALDFLERVYRWSHSEEMRSSIGELLVRVREAIANRSSSN